jgi:hypothetical protein
MTTLPASLTPSLSDVAKSPYGAAVQALSMYHACDPHIFPTLSTTPASCTGGNVNGTVNYVLIGDSTTANWAPELSAGLANSTVKLSVFPYTGCAPLLFASPPAALASATTPACEAWLHNLIPLVAALKPAVVMIAFGPTGTSAVQAQMASAMALSFNAFAPKPTTKRLLLGDVAYFMTPVATCLSIHQNPKLCASSLLAGANPNIVLRINAMAKSAGARVVSERPYLCTTTVCDAVVGNIMTSVDEDHFTLAFSQFLTPYVTADILSALKQ